MHTSMHTIATVLFMLALSWPMTAQEQKTKHLEVTGTGTGFFVSKDGYLLTNHHVIKGAERVAIKTVKGQLKANIVKIDPQNDLALLKVDGNFNAIPISSNRKLHLGEEVFTIGYPRPAVQGFAPKLTKGEISSLTGIKDDPRTYQISVPIQPGNSGGPLVDSRGNVVGIVLSTLNANFLFQRVQGLDIPQNVNYAIKSSAALKLIGSVKGNAITKIQPMANDETREFKAIVISVESATVPVLKLSKPKPAIFENTLGMRFTIIPGTNVAFSIWETRVKDYSAFAQANRIARMDWKEIAKNLQGNDDLHPVAAVSWSDATAFCAWLTKKERGMGKISPRAVYRLPTDSEWSEAVGLKGEAGSTAAEKNRGIRNEYPWGNNWPPPKNAGNYFETDTFTWTSPVGSFPANKFGLFDMGGNVGEWCADLYDPMNKNLETSRLGLLRGASFENGAHEKLILLSSARWPAPKNGRANNFGFRCVLAKE